MCVALEYCLPGTYNNGENKCLECPAFCRTCNYGTGICNQCESPTMEIVLELTDPIEQHNWHVHEAFTNTTEGACRCPPHFTFDGTDCIELASYGSGNYNDGNDVQKACAGNCSECLDFTGECVQCPNENDWVLDKKLNDCICKPGYLLVSGEC